MCLDQVAGQRLGQVLVVERAEVARRGEVQVAPLATPERVIRDLAHQVLHEADLPLARRPEVVIHGQELATHEGFEPFPRDGRIVSRHRDQRAWPEAAAEDTSGQQKPALRPGERVDPRGDQAVEGVGHLDRRRLAGSRRAWLGAPVGRSGTGRLVGQDADDLHRVERNAAGVLQDLPDERLGKVR